MLIREPPRDDGPARRVSLRASVDELDVSAIARMLRRRRPPAGRGLLERRSRSTRSRARPPGIRGAACPPRALEPAGVALVDKPAGPSSFAIVAQIRRVTARAHRARGHARSVRDRAAAAAVGTRDEARAVARRARQALPDDDRPDGATSTGDPEGDVVERLEPPDDDELESGSQRCAARSSCRSRRRPR